MTGPLLTHLTQSTVFAALTAFLLFALRVRQPGVRHTAWLLAALKFALPVSLLTGLGGSLRTLAPQALSIAWRFSSTPVRSQPAPAASIETALLCLWLAGALCALGVWLWRWRRRPVATHSATERELAILRRLQRISNVRRVSLRHATGQSVPALCGIWDPIICISPDLSGQLDPAEFEAVLLHELAHARRRDNLISAAVHFIACLFWFHPMLWWIERQLGAEAERACDQLVLAWGASGVTYASGILKVCRLQIEIPLAGVSGMASNLSGRLDSILLSDASHHRALTGATAVAALAAAMTLAPVALGFLSRPIIPRIGPPPVSIVAERSPQPAPAPVRTPRQRHARPKLITQTIVGPASIPLVTEQPGRAAVSCAYMGIWFPEGTVGHQGHSDRMCVPDANNRPWWALAETANHAQLGDTLDFNAMFARPKVSQ